MARAISTQNPQASADPLEQIDAQIKSIRREVGELRKPVIPRTSPARQTIAKFDKSAAAGWAGNYGELGMGEFFMDVKNYYMSGGQKSENLGHYLNGWDVVRKSLPPRMRKAVPAGMNEMQGADGGFLVPPQFAQQLLMRAYDNDLLSRTTMFPISGKTLSLPAVAETSRADGSRFGGIQAYWREEGASLTTSAPTFSPVTLDLKELILLVRVTSELLEDTGFALETYLNQMAAQELQFKIGDALINGTGVGQPRGLMQSTCKIAQAAETGQAAGTINTQNIVKMWSRLWHASKKDAVWLVNQDVEPALYTLTLGVGTAGVVTYMPPGGLSDKPYATLMGRPVIETEFNQTLGTEGDIILADLSQMLSGTKGGVQSASSIHVYFSTNELAFRFILRMDALAWWLSALTPKNGSATKSPFVTLATRS